MGMSHATAVVDVAAAATDEIVAAVAGKVITVHGFILCADTASTLIAFKSAATVISGTLRAAANGSLIAPVDHQGWYKTAPGEALNITSTTGATTGCIRYSVG